jgi:GTP cyclohydrolase II
MKGGTFVPPFYFIVDSNNSSFLVTARLPTLYGGFEMTAFSSGDVNMPHLSLTNLSAQSEIVNVRIHSECMTGDVFGSTRCDCGEQLHASLDYIKNNGGIVIYLRQEGRGIGLVNKLHAYNLQDQGMDTIEANHALGFPTDERDFSIAKFILNHFGVSRINLLTNNPDKLEVFDNSGIEVVSRIPLVIAARPENQGYLDTKRDGMGHLI